MSFPGALPRWKLPPMVVPGKVSRVEGEAKAMEAGRGVMWVNINQPRLGTVNIHMNHMTCKRW